MPKTQLNDIEVYYEIGGIGPQILFISGSGSDLRNRPNQFDSPLAKNFELVCYDQRGLDRRPTRTDNSRWLNTQMMQPRCLIICS